MTDTYYHPLWQKNRVKFIIDLYGESFFRGKRILELGAYNGYIGYQFNQLGASVLCVEGRRDNVRSIQNSYPTLQVECANLDTPDWRWGSWDIIINFGLYYHLEKHHKEHLSNCLDNCDIMFFESVIFDSSDSEISFVHERGDDQSLSDVGGTPSTSYVEDIFKTKPVKFTKYTSSLLNGDGHFYDWPDRNTKRLNRMARRFWIINKIQAHPLL
jgi:predicted RNA methylase